MITEKDLPWARRYLEIDHVPCFSLPIYESDIGGHVYVMDEAGNAHLHKNQDKVQIPLVLSNSATADLAIRRFVSQALINSIGQETSPNPFPPIATEELIVSDGPISKTFLVPPSEFLRVIALKDGMAGVVIFTRNAREVTSK